MLLPYYIIGTQEIHLSVAPNKPRCNCILWTYLSLSFILLNIYPFFKLTISCMSAAGGCGPGFPLRS